MTVRVDLNPIQFGYEDGDRLEILPTVTNDSQSSTTDTIELRIDGTTEYSREIQFDADEEKRVKLVWDVSTSSDKQSTLTVASSDTSESDDVTLRVYDDTVRVRFEPDAQNDDLLYKQEYVEDANSVGPNT